MSSSASSSFDSATNSGHSVRSWKVCGAKDAKRLGEQITALAGKVPQGTDELNALAVELSKTRLSGKALVDTMAAVAQASGAVDASAGAKIQELVTRGQQSGRFALNGLRDLQGTGIDFEDAAQAYAEGTRKSIAAARAELTWGQASLEDGAEALRKATEAKFGDINMRNAFSLENAPRKFFDQLKVLTADVDLSAVTSGLRDAFAQLSPEAPLGAAVKTFMTTVVSGFADVAGRSIPVLLEGFKWLVVGALRVGTVFYEMKNQVLAAFNTDDWVGVGKSIIEGLVNGIKAYYGTVVDAVKGLATSVKQAFSGPQGIDAHSPSKAFEKYGRFTTEGYAQGVERGQQRATGALLDMADSPGGGSAGTSGGGGGGDRIEVNFHFGGGPPTDVAALQSPQFLAQLTKAIRDARTTRGLPVTRAA